MTQKMFQLHYNSHKNGNAMKVILSCWISLMQAGMHYKLKQCTCLISGH